MSSTVKRAGIYARISIEDTNVPKIDNQIAACTALVMSEGLEVAAIYADDGCPATGRSIREGTRHKREQFNTLLKDAERGDLDVIVSVSGDRLSRNYPDGMDLVEACKDGGVVLLIDDIGYIDPAKDERGAMDLFVGGRQEIRTRTAKQRRRYNAETTQGKPLWGRRTFGFAGVVEKNAKGKDTIRWTEHDPVEADAIRWAVQHYLSPTGSIYGVMQEFNRRGLKTSAAGYNDKAKLGRSFDGAWTYAAMRTLLRNPRIAGLVARNGVIQEGVAAAWEPIVSREDWQAVQDKLDSNRSTAPGRKPSSLGSGLVRCACGLPMRATSIKTKDGMVPGLRCDSSRSVDRKGGVRHCTMRADVLDPLLVDAVVSAFLFGPADMMPGTSDGDLVSIEIELTKLHKSRSDLLVVVGEGLADMSEVSGKLRKIKLREAELAEQRAEVVAKNAKAAMLVDLRADLWNGSRETPGLDLDLPSDQLFKDAGAVKAALKERFQSLPLLQRRELVRNLLDVSIIPGQGVKVNPERRVKITHKVVVSLNDGSPDAEFV